MLSKRPIKDRKAKKPTKGFSQLGRESTQSELPESGIGGRLRRRVSTVASSSTERAGWFELYCTGTVWPSRSRRNSRASPSEAKFRLYFARNVSPERVYEYARMAS